MPLPLNAKSNVQKKCLLTKAESPEQSVQHEKIKQMLPLPSLPIMPWKTNPTAGI